MALRNTRDWSICSISIWVFVFIYRYHFYLLIRNDDAIQSKKFTIFLSILWNYCANRNNINSNLATGLKMRTNRIQKETVHNIVIHTLSRDANVWFKNLDQGRVSNTRSKRRHRTTVFHLALPTVGTDINNIVDSKFWNIFFVVPHDSIITISWSGDHVLCLNKYMDQKIIEIILEVMEWDIHTS